MVRAVVLRADCRHASRSGRDELRLCPWTCGCGEVHGLLLVPLSSRHRKSNVLARVLSWWKCGASQDGISNGLNAHMTMLAFVRITPTDVLPMNCSNFSLRIPCTRHWCCSSSGIGIALVLVRGTLDALQDVHVSEDHGKADIPCTPRQVPGHLAALCIARPILEFSRRADFST